MVEVPEWYWLSEKQKEFERQDTEYLKEHPCLCFADENNPPPFRQCYCLDGVTPIDFCKAHGGYNELSSECLCCSQLPLLA